jgi:small subunit ribosomal protein S16
MVRLRTVLGGNKLTQKVIRLRRRGHINLPFYDIVLIHKNLRCRGAFIEKLGYFNPNFSERTIVIDIPRLAYWLNHGAMVHNTVKKYIIKFLH